MAHIFTEIKLSNPRNNVLTRQAWIIRCNKNESDRSATPPRFVADYCGYYEYFIVSESRKLEAQKTSNFLCVSIHGITIPLK
jgi:hypothetical protein